jgi:hypothetical protein
MKNLFCALLVLANIAVVPAQTQRPTPANASSNLMPVEDVRAGMKGYGMTVFQGTTPERFEVEILGALQGVPNPKGSLVIAKLSGPQVDRTGVFAGMSGSPVYIDGKLLGAVAYAFPFAKEAIAGITPIKSMIDIFEQGSGEPPASNQRVSFGTLVGASTTGASSANLPAQLRGIVGPHAASSAALTPYVGQTIAPIATPVSFSGISQSALDLFASDLAAAGIHAIAGLGGSSSLAPMSSYNDNTLTPGSSVNVQLVRGDFSIDAAGTVTYRDGQRIYAFGHPFLSSGATSWPMSESSVVTVVPNINNSFKLATGEKLVGSINQDRSTGIFGQLGAAPRMLPVSVKVRTSRSKTETYNFEVVADPFLTPLLVRITLFSSIAATERQIGQQTLKIGGRIQIEGQPDVLLDNSFTSANGAAMFAVTAVAQPIAVLLNSGLGPVNLKGIDIDVTSADARSNGTLSRIWVDKTEVRRGETLELQAFARGENGEFVERIPFVVPADAPVGPLTILVGDGTAINQVERSLPSAEFVPKDLGQLVRAINRLKKNYRLYVKVFRPGTGAIVNNEEMPVLPPSMLATLGSQRTSGGFTPLQVATLAEHELPPSRFIITGQQNITINVIK